MALRIVTDMEDKPKEHSGNKYRKRIQGFGGHVVIVDVYRVIEAFNVTDAGLQHALKKILMPGLRGKGGRIKDLTEAIDAIQAEVDKAGEVQVLHDQ